MISAADRPSTGGLSKMLQAVPTALALAIYCQVVTVAFTALYYFTVPGAFALTSLTIAFTAETAWFCGSASNTSECAPFCPIRIATFSLVYAAVIAWFGCAAIAALVVIHFVYAFVHMLFVSCQRTY